MCPVATMAGTRVPSNKERSDISMVPVEHEFKYYNMEAHTYQSHAAAAQRLYTQVWEGMRNRVDAYFGPPRAQPLPTHANFSSTQNALTHEAYSGAARNMDSTMEFGSLIKSEADLNSSGMEEESGTVVPTIQFDLGSNFLNCSAQPDNMGSFSNPYDYSGSSSCRVDSQVDGSQSCLTSNPSLPSTLWTENFPSSNRNSSAAGLGVDNVPTVDYTTRWGGANNLNAASAGSQGSMGNNLQPVPESFESRLRPYVDEPSPAVGQKIEQALKQRLYVLDRKGAGDPENPLACEFRVLGSTGSLNSVRISTLPSCTCAGSEHNCVHVLFVLLRVLKVSVQDYRLWQTALLTCEVVPLLRKAMMDYNGIVRQQMRQRLLEMSSQGGGDGGQADIKEQLQAMQSEMSGSCPVCFEMMTGQDGSTKEELTFCRNCHNSMHKDCLEKWSYAKQESGERFACLFCRAPWLHGHDATATSFLKKRKADPDADHDAYGNLADYSGDQRGPEDMAFERLYPHSRSKPDRAWGGC